MGTRKTAESKRNWLKIVFKQAYNKGISLNENKLIAQFCIEFSATRKTAKEIVNQFILAEYVVRYNGDLIDPKLLKGGVENVGQRTL